MLPFYYNLNKTNKTIYINPNFKGQLPTPECSGSLQSVPIIPSSAHINPLFLEPRKYGNTIHMNPAFLQNFQQVDQKIVNDKSAVNPLSKEVPSVKTRKIICKSKNRLIREPLEEKDEQHLRSKSTFALQPLLVLNKRKLIRKASIALAKPNNQSKKIFNDSKTRITKYKLDNRLRKLPLLPPTPKIKRTSYVGQYALKRTLSETPITSAKRSLSVNKNIKLQVLNINGLLYKSTRNSLKLKNIATVETKSSTPKEKLSSNPGLIIFVRGDKYVMDSNKFKLTRVTNCDHGASNRITNSNILKAPTCKRIDIGGYTYVSINSAKNVLIRTKTHLSRAHVHNAKQKSLQMLTKRLVKTNIPCPIFQRIGKCAAFERGRCSKAHNKLQVAICSKFLRGECTNTNCLLSHNVSLSKMPVCKFFLQGVCVRNDCPYLHKKLSNSAEICNEFLRGFCQMADKCNKRHEFLCPELERNGICAIKNCVYCNAKRRKEIQSETKSEKLINKNLTVANHISAESNEIQSSKRYFIDPSVKPTDNLNQNKAQPTVENNTNIDVECDEENIENNSRSRPKLGSLPSYIPL